MELAVFVIAAAIVLGGALGVIVSRNPVHAALSLVATLFGIAVLFVAQDAQLLAAVQVIVYTGAIVILILFVIMLLGIDRDDDLTDEPIRSQRALATVLGLGMLVVAGAVVWVTAGVADNGSVAEVLVTGRHSTLEGIDEPDDPEAESNIVQIGNVLFTDYVFAFEVTAALLTIAVVGAVALSRRSEDEQDLPERFTRPVRPRRGATDAEGSADPLAAGDAGADDDPTPARAGAHAEGED